MVTKNLAILFTDVKGFTDKTSKHSRRQIESFLKLQDEVIKPRISNFKGELIKTIGDSYMAIFESPTNAVLSGIAIQDSVEAYNEILPKEKRFSLRIGINAGEVNVKDGDVFGEPVNIASRVESLAGPGKVFLTEVVYLAMNKNEISAKEVGYKNLKGVKDEVKIYKVVDATKRGNVSKASLFGFLGSKNNKGDKMNGRSYRYLSLLVLLFLFLAVGEYRSLIERDKVVSPSQEIKGESTSQEIEERVAEALRLEESEISTPSSTPIEPEPTIAPDQQVDQGEEEDKNAEDENKGKDSRKGRGGKD